MITRRTALSLLSGAAALPLLPLGTKAKARDLEPDFLKILVAKGKLPPVEERLPVNPRIVKLGEMGRATGRHGGTLRTLIGGQRGIRLVPINSYARLVGYDEDLNLVPDLLASFEVDEESRVFTFKLREGHRWSDGSPFTAEDFRYCWEDVILNEELYRGGPPAKMLIDGKPPIFEVLDELTVRYTWHDTMPDFLANLAQPVPLKIFMPSTYLKQFHAKYQPSQVLEDLSYKYRVDDWVRLHKRVSRTNRPENPDLPTLEAWMPRTSPPAEQFVFTRNPYYHRVDENGLQLPYVDRLELNVGTNDIIPAATSSGQSDLQYGGLTFSDFTLMKTAEESNHIKVRLWRRAQGSSFALYPNLTYKDPVWRDVFRDVRFRRAVSLLINREEINKALFFGLAQESANTVLPESPLYREAYARAYAQFDPDEANRLLDEMGLVTKRFSRQRHLPDGRAMDIIIETAGESTLETDVLELMTDHFRRCGIRIFTRSTQREVFRKRAIGGEIMMAVWFGLDNGVPTAEISPEALAPSADDQYQWPVWGLHYQSAMTKGEPPDMPIVMELVDLLKQWRHATNVGRKTEIWHKMLQIHADQVFTIGTLNSALQPIVSAANLRNLPEKGLYGYYPMSYLGVYMPDTFWYDEER